MGEAVFIEGEVEEIVYRNEENGYSVLEVLTVSGHVTMTGPLLSMPGEKIKAEGVFKLHPTYGEQFQVSSYESLMPSEAGAILQFLSSGAVPGVGPKTAKNLTDHFKEDTLLILEEYPERLLEVKGMTKARAGKIADAFKARFTVRKTLAFLSGLGLDLVQAMHVYKMLETDAIDKVSSNPYILSGEGIGFSFELSDEVAERLHKKEIPGRIKACLSHIIRHNYKNGHTYLPFDTLASVSAGFLQEEEAKIYDFIEEMLEDGELIKTKIFEEEAIYLPSMFAAEYYSAAKLAELTGAIRSDEGFKEEIEELEERLNIKYAPQQKRAITGAMTSGVFIITGGPGTGKTTIINGILRLCERRSLKICMAAPTGRAAKRMTEVTGFEAKTIHRLLQVEFKKGDMLRFAKNEKNPLKEDVVIIDECSMLDIPLFEALLRAVKPGASLILVGDSFQLPSIGAGDVLKSLISGDCLDFMELTEIFRQAGDSLIVVNAHSINHGEYPDIEQKNNDFFFLTCKEEKDVPALVSSLCRDRLPRAYKIDPLTDVQVIAPTRKTLSGTGNLNQVLQDSLNPKTPGKKELIFQGSIFREGDKVMQTKNNYSLEWESRSGEAGTGVFNGDIGIILSVNPKLFMLEILYDDRVAVYTVAEMGEIEHAFAVTVHKAQGSEFPIVIIPLYFAPKGLLTRNMIYTAVTRAKERVILLGRPQTLMQMVDNNDSRKRYSGLSFFLRQEILGEGGR